MELTAISVQRLLETQELWFLSSHYVWMSILVNLILFVPPAVVFGLLAPYRPGLFYLRVAVIFLGFWLAILLLAYVSAIFSLGLALWAASLLALGLAVSVSRLAAARPEPFFRLLRVCSPMLLLGSLVLALATVGSRKLGEWRSPATAAPAAKSAPNVLLIVMDAARAKSMSLHGHDRPTTPGLERWAEGGVVFDAAVAPSPWTLPSHASMFTGDYPHELDCDQNTPLAEDAVTLAEVLRDRGYATAGFVGNIRYCHRYTGLAQGFDTWRDAGINWQEFAYNSWLARFVLRLPEVKKSLPLYDELGRKPAATVNAEFLDWLDRRPQDRPFFVFLNYYDAHDPYLPEGAIVPAGEPLSTSQKEMMSDWRHRALFEPGIPEDDVQLARVAYEERIRELDGQIDRLLTGLQEQGILDNTLLIITADHGEQFGEHGLLFHWNSLYRPSLHVPLMVRLPDGSGAGRRVESIVNLRNLGTTTLELLGMESDALPGDSFAALCTGATQEAGAGEPTHASVEMRDYLPSWQRNSQGPIHAVFADGMQYIREDGTGLEALYDFLNDPEENRDLSGQEAYRDQLEQFRQVVEPATPP